MSESASVMLELPQEGPARLVTRMIDRRADGGKALACIPLSSPFRRPGAGGAVVPAVIAVEMAAQAAAALEQGPAESTAAHERSGPGLVVGLKAVRFSVGELAADREYEVELVRDGYAPPLGIWSFRVRLANLCVAEGELLTYVRS